MVRRSSTVQKRIDHFYRTHILRMCRCSWNMGFGGCFIDQTCAHESGTRRDLQSRRPITRKVSFDQPEYTFDVTGTGVLRLLERYAIMAIQRIGRYAFIRLRRQRCLAHHHLPKTKIRHTGPESLCRGESASFWHTVNYREAYNLHCSNGILFNHESERRGENLLPVK